MMFLVCIVFCNTDKGLEVSDLFIILDSRNHPSQQLGRVFCQTTSSTIAFDTFVILLVRMVQRNFGKCSNGFLDNKMSILKFVCNSRACILQGNHITNMNGEPAGIMMVIQSKKPWCYLDKAVDVKLEISLM